MIQSSILHVFEPHDIPKYIEVYTRFLQILWCAFLSDVVPLCSPSDRRFADLEKQETLLVRPRDRHCSLLTFRVRLCFLHHPDTSAHKHTLVSLLFKFLHCIALQNFHKRLFCKIYIHVMTKDIPSELISERELLEEEISMKTSSTVSQTFS